MTCQKLFFGSGKDHPVLVATDVRDYLKEDKKYQYRDGFSMAEAAKSWVSAADNLPRSIQAAVGSGEFDSAHFEFPTIVWGGGTAMTDIMAFLPNGVIAVEAKCNEPFDDLVSVWIERDARTNAASPPHRRKVILRYAAAFSVQPESLLGLRYQLLQRTLCAALTARTRGQSQSWMIIQSFAPSASDGHVTNRNDFARFQDLVGVAPVIEGVSVHTAWVDATQSQQTIGATLLTA